MSKRVLEIVSGLGVGGAEKSFISRLKYLPDGWTTSIINTLPWINGLKVPEGVLISDVSRNRPLFLYFLFRRIRGHSPDIVIVRSPIDYLFLAIVKIVVCADWKLIFEAHSKRISSNKFIEYLLWIPMRILIGQADLVIAVSKSVAEGNQCFGGHNVIIHYLGSESRITFSKRENTEFLFAARMVPLKRPKMILRAVNELSEVFRAQGAVLQMVGTGPLEPEILKFISSNSLEDVVIFNGPQQSLDTLYSRCDYLISCSSFEGLPLTFFEAKLNGLRIITTPSSGDFDVLGKEDSVLPDFDFSTLKSAISEALQTGISSDQVRSKIQIENKWMDVSNQAPKFYSLLKH